MNNTTQEKENKERFLFEDNKANYFSSQEYKYTNYTIHHFEDAEKEFKSLLVQTRDLCETSEDDSIKLLLKCQWNFEKLTNIYFGDDNLKKKFMVEGGIIAEKITSENETMCPGCQEAFSENKPYFALICNHKFCHECWENYLISSLDRKSVV